MTPLYPLQLTVTTPYGTSDFGPVVIGTPNVLRETRLRASTDRVALSGRAVLQFSPASQGRQLVLSIPDEHACPLALALPLQRCAQGDRVSITENLTRRDIQRIWTGLIVTEPNTGTWVAGNPEQGDHFSILMTFRLP